jgi:hypothetical protein
VVFIGSVVVLIVLMKWWQRLRFYKKLRVARVTVDDLKSMLDRGESPIVLDVRTRGARLRDLRRIPSAIVASSPRRSRSSSSRCRRRVPSFSIARDQTRPQPPVWRAC